MRQLSWTNALLATGLLAVTFMTPAFATQQRKATPTSGAARCAISVTAPWIIPALGNRPQKRLSVEAFSDGPTCEKAVVVVVIRSQSGYVLYQAAHNAEENGRLFQVRTRTEMREALVDFTEFRTNAAFYRDWPEWPVGASGPVEREFSFRPEEGMNRGEYLDLKAARLPGFCYVTGIESFSCFVYREGLSHGIVQPIGGQGFPG